MYGSAFFAKLSVLVYLEVAGQHLTGLAEGKWQKAGKICDNTMYVGV